MTAANHNRHKTVRRSKGQPKGKGQPEGQPKGKGQSKSRTFCRKDYSSGDGFVTKIWGPALWHALHTISFNYPVHPTVEQKRQYRQFILNLRNVLPCKYCRQNLTKNLAAMPLTMDHMASRDAFSKYMYRLHEKVNTLLKKKSGLTYADVRERYEHFRSRCKTDPTKNTQTETTTTETTATNGPTTINKSVKSSVNKTDRSSNNDNNKTKHKGCTEPLYGKKSKCIIKIVPQTVRGSSMQIDHKCIATKRKRRLNNAT
jgi:hypothetical protein